MRSMTGVLCLASALALAPAARGADWPQFNFDPQHSGHNPLESAIGPGNVATLRPLYEATLPAVADGAPVFLAGVQTPLGVLDLLFLTTMDGRLLARDAATGTAVWSRQPLASFTRYTTSSPAIDPDRQHVYSYGLDGFVHKYRTGDGVEVTGGGWPQLTSLKPDVEKASSALAVATASSGTSRLYVAHGGYPGDEGDYQGHLTTIDLATGAQRVFNAACSNQTVHFTDTTPDCPEVQSALWARQGVVYDPADDRIYVATGNGLYNGNQGGFHWGDTVFSLRADGSGTGGKPLDAYTPTSFQELQDVDDDLGSTAPAILPVPASSHVRRLAVQSGKDQRLRLLDLDDLSGQGGVGHVGGELQNVPVPQLGRVMTAPAVWRNPADGSTWLFVANDNGIAGLQLAVDGGGNPSLAERWTSPVGGTSPIVAGGVLFYQSYDGLRALLPTTGAELWRDASLDQLHWQSPIVVGGRLYAVDGQGILRAWAPSQPPAPCVVDATTACLSAGRFSVRTTWRTADGRSGDGQALGLTADTAYFWFFSPTNIELVIKVLDACSFSERYWAFGGGLTDVRVVITVTDSHTGVVRVYNNPLGSSFQPLLDTNAFATCP